MILFGAINDCVASTVSPDKHDKFPCYTDEPTSARMIPVFCRIGGAWELPETGGKWCPKIAQSHTCLWLRDQDR